nr:hypothetical protein [Litoribacterium kuwaitense]
MKMNLVEAIQKHQQTIIEQWTDSLNQLQDVKPSVYISDQVYEQTNNEFIEVIFLILAMNRPYFQKH